MLGRISKKEQNEGGGGREKNNQGCQAAMISRGLSREVLRKQAPRYKNREGGRPYSSPQKESGGGVWYRLLRGLQRVYAGSAGNKGQKGQRERSGKSGIRI